MRLFLIASTFLVTSSAYASVIVSDTPSGTGNNLIFNNSCSYSLADPNGPATLVQGCLNGQPTALVSVTGTENLITNPGQARVEAATAPDGDGRFTTLTIEFTDPSLYFNELVLNINPEAAGNVTFSVNPSLTFGTAASWALSGTGNNFFTITTTGGDLIRSFTLTSDVGLVDVRQIRFGDPQRQPVPEPASMALMGLGLAALGFQRRRSA